MIDHIVELYRGLHAKVPDATLDELREAIIANPNGDVSSLALAIIAVRPDDDDLLGPDELRSSEWRQP